jgi:hypothetical protein
LTLLATTRAFPTWKKSGRIKEEVEKAQGCLERLSL